MGCTIFSVERYELVLAKQRVYDEQCGQFLCPQAQGSCDSVGDQDGKLKHLFFSGKKKPLHALDVR